MKKFDAEMEAKILAKQTKTIRKRHFRNSRLYPLTSEILQLNNCGASQAEILRWLVKRRIRISHSTLSRWLSKNG